MFTQEEIRDGSSIVVAVDRSAEGGHRLRKEATFENVAVAIQMGGDLSQREWGVLVATFSGGAPLIVARYGDAWGEL